jgi:hypothetical protein
LNRHGYWRYRSLWSLIVAHAVPSVPKETNDNPFDRRAALRRGFRMRKFLPRMDAKWQGEAELRSAKNHALPYFSS